MLMLYQYKYNKNKMKVEKCTALCIRIIQVLSIKVPYTTCTIS